MNKTVRSFAVSLALLALAVAASGQQVPAGKKKAPAASAKTKAVHRVASKTGTKTTSSSKAAASKMKAKVVSKTGTKTRRPVVARRPPTQQQPTADRYKEIQQALVEKGYFHGSVDGAWNAGSVEALKRFQKDQNLDPDGKIGSLSLIALGLGPKRGGGATQTIPSSSEPIESPPAAQPR